MTIIERVGELSANHGVSAHDIEHGILAIRDALAYPSPATMAHAISACAFAKGNTKLLAEIHRQGTDNAEREIAQSAKHCKKGKDMPKWNGLHTSWNHSALVCN